MVLIFSTLCNLTAGLFVMLKYFKWMNSSFKIMDNEILKEYVGIHALLWF